MLHEIEYAFQEVGIHGVLTRARNVYINEYVDSVATTVKLCGITVREVEQVEQLLIMLNQLTGKRVKIYHHISVNGSYGGIVIRFACCLLSPIELLKVEENIMIKTIH